MSSAPWLMISSRATDQEGRASERSDRYSCRSAPARKAIGREMTTACIAGIGATEYYRRGQSAPASVLELAVTAVTAALADAGLTVRDIDGFAAFAGGLDTARLAQCLGVPEVRFTATQQGGGGGSAGAIGLAAAAIDTGKADVVVTVTALQQTTYRLGRGDATSG